MRGLQSEGRGGLKPLLWFSGPARHRVVPVYLSCPAISNELADCIGVTSGADDIAIWIDVTPSREVQDATLLHEWVHACVWGLKFKPKEEEGIADMVGEEMIRMLKSVGFTWPRRPRGAAALEAFARKNTK